MLVLFETPAGYAVFKVLKRFKKVENLAEEFESPDTASKIVKLKAFEKFKDSKSALRAASACIESRLSQPLRKFLQKNIVDKGIEDQLLVCDKKIRGVIEEKLGISCLYSSKYMELLRGIRSQFENLITGITEKEYKAMTLGLSHSLSRHTLKFSADKVDIMIVQAISLLDDIDKELNNYAMRLKEWYGWHFPELAKIVGDNVVYAKIVKKIGMRQRAKKRDISDLVPEDLEEQIREAAEISMGTEISTEDVISIRFLCDQVTMLAEYRGTLHEYLKNRMYAVAPNLSVLVGELVGARLIAHAGSLVNLSKHPASTVQILGAEKALFRAIKTRHDTPKYGLIYHASVIGSAQAKMKGKISRSLAAKCALCIRLDALGEQTEPTIGLQHKEAIDNRIKYLEGEGNSGGFSRGLAKYSKPSGITQYNPQSDETSKIEKKPRKAESSEEEEPKPKKKRSRKVESSSEEEEKPRKKRKVS